MKTFLHVRTKAATYKAEFHGYTRGLMPSGSVSPPQVVTVSGYRFGIAPVRHRVSDLPDDVAEQILAHELLEVHETDDPEWDWEG